MTTANDEDSIWIITEPTMDGKSYVITINFTQDYAVTLSPVDATEYAKDVLAAVARSEYDAALMRQFTEQVGLEHAYAFVKDLRADRPPLTATDPMQMEPGVAMDDGPKFRPFIALKMAGKGFGQFDSAGAREHALGLLEIIAVSDLDAAYKRALIGQVGLDEPTAKAAVDGLAKWR